MSFTPFQAGRWTAVWNERDWSVVAGVLGDSERDIWYAGLGMRGQFALSIPDATV